MDFVSFFYYSLLDHEGRLSFPFDNETDRPLDILFGRWRRQIGHRFQEYIHSRIGEPAGSLIRILDAFILMHKVYMRADEIKLKKR